MKRFGWLVASSAMALALPAAGQSVSYTGVAYGYDATDNIYVPGFDSSLGTLTGISVDASVHGFYSGGAYSTGEFENAPSTFYLDITGPASLTFFYDQIPLNIAVTPDEPGVVISGADFFILNYSGAGSFAIDPNDFGSFIDTDNTYAWGRIAPATVAYIYGPGAVQAQVDVTGVQAVFDYTVTYSYAAAAVPEPATWGLMIAGFGAVGGVMRRRWVGHEMAVEAS